MKSTTKRILTTLVIVWACCCSTVIVTNDACRRAEIKKAEAEILFKNTNNHYNAFRYFVRVAGSKANDTAMLLEDLKFVLVGSTQVQRGSSLLYIGNTTGARGVSWLKGYLRDGSAQGEHLMATNYIGKMAKFARNGIYRSII